MAPEQVAMLYQLILPISKLSGSGVENSSSNNQGSSWLTRNGSMLRLDDAHLQLSTAGRTQDTDGIQCFAELDTIGFSSIFLEKVIESAAPHNAIVMELDLVQLRLALKSILGDSPHGQHGDSMMMAPGGGQTVLKLAKRNNIPCLCLDAITPGTTLIQIHHAVPVRIRKHQEMQNHMPPPHTVPDVQLELISATKSSIAPLRTIVEKLKPLSPVLYLEASSTTGELTVSAYQDGASVQAFFSKLTPRHTTSSADHASPPPTTTTPNKTTATVKMDTKKLGAALQGLQNSSSSSSASGSGGNAIVNQAVLCLVENEMVVVHVNLQYGVGFFTYYVPVHFLLDEDDDDDEDE